MNGSIQAFAGIVVRGLIGVIRMAWNRHSDNKYGSKKIEVDGIVFDSKKEAKRYSELLLLEKAGEISDLQRQVKYVLIPAQYAEVNGKRKCIERECVYISDFTYIENVIEANLKACLAPHEAAGEAFNVAYGGREYLIDIYYGLTKALSIEREPNFGPDRAGDIKHSNADISKAKNLLGYDPDWSFERGIEAAIEWYKENL